MSVHWPSLEEGYRTGASVKTLAARAQMAPRSFRNRMSERGIKRGAPKRKPECIECGAEVGHAVRRGGARRCPACLVLSSHENYDRVRKWRLQNPGRYELPLHEREPGLICGLPLRSDCDRSG